MLILLLLCCAATPRSSSGEGWTLDPVKTEGSAGLSGLAQGPDGQLWSVTERPPALLRLSADGRRVIARLPITGLPDGAEPESVAVTDEGAIWVGTEGRLRGRAIDEIVELTVDAEEARAGRRRPFPWAAWGIVAGGNEGVEGLCAAGAQLIAAGEPVRSQEGRRLAPIGLYQDGSWLPLWLALPSENGKVSALWCQRGEDGGLDIAFIERHYDVLRLGQTRIPAGIRAGAELPTATALPLSKSLRVSAPTANFEGLALQGESWLMLSDNQGAGLVGTTWLARLPVR